MKYLRLSEHLDIFVIDNVAKLREMRQDGHVIEITAIEAVALADWLTHEFLEIERPERVVPEQGDGPF